jgi:tetratricopeptide (TPR) repeat protein
VYRAVAPLHGTAVPSTVQAVLAARIDRLSDEDRRLLQSAAVIGKDVPLALLDAIAGTPADALRRWLARLQSADFLYETRAFPDLEFTFKHALTHEVAYKTLLHDRRRTLHARIAEAIETLHADRLGEHVERLAHHAVAGERWEMAVTYARQAGTKALARSAYREAVGHFEQAVAAIAHLPAARTMREVAVDLRFELRTALAPLGAHEQIAAHLGEAEKLAAELGDDARRGRVSAYLADYFRQVGEHERAISAGERALAIARRLGDPTLEVASNTYLGQACQNTGQYRRAMTLFRRTADLAGGDLVGGTFGLPFVSSVQSRIWLASCLNELGEFATGIQVAEEAIRIAETASHAASLATACSVLGNLYLRRGEPADAVAVLERGYELSQAGDLHIWTPNAESWLGLAYVTLGRVDEGLRLLQSAVERERSMRRLAHHAVRLTALAEGLVRVGRGAEALGAVAQALALARNQGERGNEAHAHRAGGDIAAGAASSADAEAAYQHGLALAAELEMRPVAARCHLGLARLWRASGRDADARLHRQRALALFEAMGARALAGQALAKQAFD